MKKVLAIILTVIMMTATAGVALADVYAGGLQLGVVV